ncbi:hypothetical protein LA5095_02716 [Roseibium album]|uniref:Uncharacterized protein n=1 Tax=Roseibium album TaxID=311410 RepID=A0A0M6ZNE5_9HYPH|nr:hypothetical protein LA5094_01662 [Roseibium album]CTQ63640.1 hypothetical protein LA5096_00085 [Roseibium album]CTQ73229.1 hypothetical protein LA5095_02716 [Roseibium album]
MPPRMFAIMRQPMKSLHPVVPTSWPGSKPMNLPNDIGPLAWHVNKRNQKGPSLHREHKREMT